MCFSLYLILTVWGTQYALQVTSQRQSILQEELPSVQSCPHNTFLKRGEENMSEFFHPNMGLFEDKADNRSDGLENHHRAFQASDDI